MTFYTYMWLREDGTPYYVGKGQGKRAIRKGSPSLDRILIQEFPSEADAFAAEMFLISFYGRRDNSTGILRNLTDGGEGPSGYQHTGEWKQEASKRQSGHRHTEQSLRRLAEATRRENLSEETRQRRSEALLGNTNALGTKMSEEARGRCSAAWTPERKAARSHQLIGNTFRQGKVPHNKGKKMSAAQYANWYAGRWGGVSSNV